MIQNSVSRFHKVIVALLCCIVLVGCGYKTKPIYVPKSVAGELSEKV